MPEKAPFAIPVLAPLILGAGALAAFGLSRAQSSATLPTRVALIIPRDFRNTPKQYVSDWRQAEVIVKNWLVGINQWLRSQVGHEPFGSE